MECFSLILLAFSLICGPNRSIVEKTSDVKGEIIGRYSNLQIDEQEDNKGQEIADSSEPASSAS